MDVATLGTEVPCCHLRLSGKMLTSCLPLPPAGQTPPLNPILRLSCRVCSEARRCVGFREASTRPLCELFRGLRCPSHALSSFHDREISARLSLPCTEHRAVVLPSLLLADFSHFFKGRLCKESPCVPFAASSTMSCHFHRHVLSTSCLPGTLAGPLRIVDSFSLVNSPLRR